MQPTRDSSHDGAPHRRRPGSGGSLACHGTTDVAPALPGERATDTGARLGLLAGPSNLVATLRDVLV